MILGGGLDPRVNQSVATSIHRAEASLTAKERVNTEATIVGGAGSGGFSDPINFGLRNANGGAADGMASSGLKGPLD